MLWYGYLSALSAMPWRHMCEWSYSSIDGCEWLTSRQFRFTLEKQLPVTIVRRLSGPQRQWFVRDKNVVVITICHTCLDFLLIVLHSCLVQLDTDALSNNIWEKVMTSVDEFVPKTEKEVGGILMQWGASQLGVITVTNWGQWDERNV